MRSLIARRSRYGKLFVPSKPTDGYRWAFVFALFIANCTGFRRMPPSHRAASRRIGLDPSTAARARGGPRQTSNRPPTTAVMSPHSFSNWATGKTSSWPWPQRFFTSLSVIYVGIRAGEFADRGGNLGLIAPDPPWPGRRLSAVVPSRSMWSSSCNRRGQIHLPRAAWPSLRAGETGR